VISKPLTRAANGAGVDEGCIGVGGLGVSSVTIDIGEVVIWVEIGNSDGSVDVAIVPLQALINIIRIPNKITPLE
jgi:hypothetical protein